jgi:hypothetical protein
MGNLARYMVYLTRSVYLTLSSSRGPQHQCVSTSFKLTDKVVCNTLPLTDKIVWLD